jgi:predicted enzyme related to lactoylglutathione lyase
MTTHLFSVSFDADSIPAQARYWSEALGWSVVRVGPEGTMVAPVSEPGIAITFVQTSEKKAGKNRIHFDLASRSVGDQTQIVQRLLSQGAKHIDIGQGDVPWVVLADPEGNEFCVSPPNDQFASAGSIGAIAFDAGDPFRMGEFWSAAAGWDIVSQSENHTALRRPSGDGPFITLGPPLAGKITMNRLRFDLSPGSASDERSETDRLVAIGAERTDAGLSGLSSSWLKDPEGNEFCVLSPEYVRQTANHLPPGAFRNY